MKEDLTYKKIVFDYQRAYAHKRKFLEAAKEDHEFYLGHQWEDQDIQTLTEAGVRPLTINKIRPQIVLLKGVESQNRTEFKAFPEGKEDDVIGEIATRLLKNLMKNSMGDYELSNIFEDGTVAGEGWLEPYIDYSEDLLFGELKFKKGEYFQIFPDPKCKKYDLSDAGYVCKICPDMTKDEILQIYPDVEDKLENSEGGRFSLDMFEDESSYTSVRQSGYGNGSGQSGLNILPDEPTWDLLEYMYKCYVPEYNIIDYKSGTITKSTKEEAENYKKAVASMSQKEADKIRIVKRMVPEIYMATIIAGVDEIVYHARIWSYPRWKGYPLINYFLINSSTKIDPEHSDLLKQGLVRQLKDLQREFNKRRTQEARHLNSSANSGWLAEDDSWVDVKKVEKFGSSPGINLYYKKGRPKPERITPAPLSQGHAQLAAENSQDIKEPNGINTDLLAMQEGGTDSGRAIALRQKQGLVMVQYVFDNFSLTKKIMGRFCLSMLGEVYDIDKAMLVLGDAFIQEYFQKPAMQPMVDPRTGSTVIDPATRQPAMVPSIDPATGQPIMMVDEELAVQTVNQVLNDPNLYKYNVEVGESASNETIKYSNYVTLLDLASKGIPIPPEILIDESLISTGNKKKIIAAIEQAQLAQAGAKPNGGKNNG